MSENLGKVIQAKQLLCVCVFYVTQEKNKNQKYTQYRYKQNKTDKDFINSFWDGFQKNHEVLEDENLRMKMPKIFITLKQKCGTQG